MIVDDEDLFDLNYGEEDFQKGDVVEFETAVDHTGMPRWRNGLDYGSSGIFASGKVTEVTDSYITVSYAVPGHVGSGSYSFPNKDNVNYVSSQWLRPGFLRRTYDAVCECGAWATYGHGTKLHTHYCPKYIDINIKKYK